MIAALGMYDIPFTAAANDRFWDLIRHQLPDAPAHLDRQTPLWEAWTSTDLLLAQTCSLPYRARLASDVTLVGTPDYGLPDCPPGYYRSLFVARLSGPETLKACAGGTLAFNEEMSQSGYVAPLLHLRDKGLEVPRMIETGAHAASARAVAEGKADLAGIDALTWYLLRQAEPGLTARLRVIARTEPSPGLPYITAHGRDPAPLRAALRQAIADLGPQDRQILQLRGLVEIPEEDYLALPTL